LVEALADQLEQAIRNHVLTLMPPDPSGEVAAKTLSDLLHTFGVWRDRHVSPRPRRVHTSNEMRASPKAQEHRDDLDTLVSRIEAGDDLTPHLSKRAATAHVPATKVKKGREHLRADRDGMLAEWGVHHLHLTPRRDKGDVLFAFFKPDDAYLIGIYPHKWTLVEVVKVVVRNWPKDGPLTEVKGVLGLSHQPTDKERRDLRIANTTTMLDIDGRVWAPRGQTLAGTPGYVMREVNKVMWALTYLRTGRYDEDLAEVECDWEAQYGRPPLRCWRPAIKDGECGLLWESFFYGLAWLP